MALAQPIPIDSVQFTTDPSGASPRAGTNVTTWGLVTGVAPLGSPTRYYLGNRSGGPWSGILVNDGLGRGLSIGDSVFLTARVEEASGQTRLTTPVSDFFSQPAVGLVAPSIATAGLIAEPYEGVLVELPGVRVTTVNSDTSYIVEDNSGSVRVGRNWTTSYDPHVGDTLTFLRGVVSYSASTFAVNPRNDGDIRFSSNRPPAISSVVNVPESPTNLQLDTIKAMIFDDSQVQLAEVYYRFSSQGAGFTAVPMFDDGQHGDGAADDALYASIIPAGPPRDSCYFYIRAVDDVNAAATSPAGAPEMTHGYYVRSSTLSIRDIQYTGDPTGGSSPYANQTVTVTGIVTGTAFGSQRSNFFMCDPGGGLWSGIYVFAPDIVPALGDSVRVTGGVVEFNGITEFSSNVQVTVLGTGFVPEPIVIPTGILADSAEAYEGVLVRIGACTVEDISEWGSDFPSFRVSDEDGVDAHVVGEAEFEYEPVVGDEFNYVVGCVDYYIGHGWEIAPRFDADIDFIDVRPPRLESAAAVGARLVNLSFNERLDSTGLGIVSNYRIVNLSEPGLPELHVESAILFTEQKTLQLRTLEQFDADKSYRVTVHQVEDIRHNVLNDAETSFAGYRPRTFTPISALYDSFDYYQDSVEIVVLRGVVNFVQDVTTSSGSRRISAFIQDESGRGFSLSQTGAASLYPGIQRGNLIEITGVVSQFSNTIQLNEFNGDPDAGDVRVIAEQQPLPVPIEIHTGDYRTQSQIVRTSHPGYFGAGTFCKVTGTIYRVDENVGGGTNIYFDDGTGSTVIRVWDSMNLDSVVLNGRGYALGELAGVTCSILGPSSTFDGDFQMLAGYVDDFTTDMPAVLPSEELVLDIIDGPNADSPSRNRPFAPDIGQSISVFYNSPATGEVRLRIFDLRGRLVKTLVNKSAGGPNRLAWDGRDDLNNFVPLGTYILHVESVRNGKTDSKTKPIVVGTKL